MAIAIPYESELLRRADQAMRGMRGMKESDPTGRAPSTPGAKLDSSKPPMMRGAIAFFPRALEAVAAASAKGADKYAWGGWVDAPDGINRYGDALVRHLCAEHRGETLDQDSKLHHAAHAAWNALARLELILREEAEKGQ